MYTIAHIQADHRGADDEMYNLWVLATLGTSVCTMVQDSCRR